MPAALHETSILQDAARIVNAQREADANHFDVILLGLINTFRDGSFASDPGIILDAFEIGRLAAESQFTLHSLIGTNKNEVARLSKLSLTDTGRKQIANELCEQSRPQGSSPDSQSFYFTRTQVERVAMISFALAGGLS